ncbi:hypothetical protein ACQP3R_05430 [Bacillus inaquosorum]|uniref:hypothetical protein n=1 Tax=Bacillus inaquosorum TaxID=483913 RepID=UPI003D02B77D
MTKNNQQQKEKQKQKHTELLGKNITDTELAQELGRLQQQLRIASTTKWPSSARFSIESIKAADSAI